MGREAKGNISDVWKFNFATSFSFSLIEQLVGNNIWNSTIIGSVTLGLIESYMNNKTLEIFTSTGYVFIKHANDNTTLLFLDLQTGTVRDCFTYYGLLGTMPCYHDKITDNAWKYGNNLLNHSSNAYSGLKNIFSVSIFSSVFVECGSLILEGFSGISLGAAAVIAIPLFITLFPDHANELWKKFAYLLNPNYKEYPNIPIIENNDPQYIINTNVLYLNQQKPINYKIITLNDDFRNYPYDKTTDKTRNQVLIQNMKINQPTLNAPAGDTPNGTDGTWNDVGIIS